VKKAQEASSATDVKSVNYFWLLLSFILGVAVGIALMFFKPFEMPKKEKKINLKDEKLLLLKLLPYRDIDADVKKIVDILEGNFYGGKKEKIDKKLLKEIVKRYNIL